MDASSATPKIGRRTLGDTLATRGGAMMIAAIAAIIAGVLLFAFVQRYKSNQNASAAATPVFVARSLIPAGSSANLIASEALLQRTTLRASQVQAGAISDPAILHGEVAAVNIYPGQQITAADFTPAVTVGSELTASQRAIAIPVDSARGLVGFVRTGDHVDLLASYGGGGGANGGSVTRLLKDVLVLSAPGAAGGGISGGNSGSNIVLRVGDKDAPSIAYASDNGKVWILLRTPLAAAQPGASSTPGASTTPTTGGH
jgi:pilus assembly protein CpaB